MRCVYIVYILFNFTIDEENYELYNSGMTNPQKTWQRHNPSRLNG